MVVYSKFVKLDIIDLLPNKYKLEYQRLLLGLSLPDNHPVLSIDNDSLTFLHDPIILPPFSRAPRGRPHSRRLEKGRVQRKVHKCHKCGLPGHHTSTCNKATDGRGHYMEPAKQKTEIEEGFLVIPISTPSLTKVPKSLAEFHEMRKVSEYPTETFSKDDRNLWIHRLVIEDNVPTPMVTEDVEDNEENIIHNNNKESHDNNEDTNIINNNTEEQHEEDTNNPEEQHEEDNNNPEEQHVEDEENSYFDYPSDTSHYTLDQDQVILSEDQKIEHDRWNQEKDEFENNNIFNRPIDYENEKVISSKERLNVGDIISYVDTNCVQGDIRQSIHRKSSTVLLVDPDQCDGEKIITSEGDTTTQVISDSTVIFRSKIYLKMGAYQIHPGKSRRLQDFTLMKQVKFKNNLPSMIAKLKTCEMKSSLTKSMKISF